MTPPATAASRALARTTPGSRRALVRHPRRISGPARPSAGPSAGSARVAAAVAVAAPGVALPRQRPARPASKPRRAPARKGSSAQVGPGIALRTVGALEAVSASALLNRLARGRIWIGLLAFSLIGIVAMQLVVLKLNTGIGGTLTRAATLQRENAQLGIEDSMYSAESRVAPLAAAAGMTLTPVGAVHFVQAAPADVSRAAAALSTPIQASAGNQTGATEPAATTASSASESSASQPGKPEPAASESSASESSAASGSTGTAVVGGAQEASPAGGSSSTAASSAATGAGTPSSESETSSPAGSNGAATTTATGGSAEPSSPGAGG
jgi:hypothetical protein